MRSLNDYAQALESALVTGGEFVAFNDDMAHATIVICLATRHAKKRIRLLSNKLDPQLYATPWFGKEARKLVDERKAHLSILVESEIEEGHPIILLSREFPDKVTILRVPDDLLSRYRYNFMVVDQQGYRFEHDREEPRALVSLNGRSKEHREFTERLTEIFDDLQARCYA